MKLNLILALAGVLTYAHYSWSQESTPCLSEAQEIAQAVTKENNLKLDSIVPELFDFSTTSSAYDVYYFTFDVSNNESHYKLVFGLSRNSCSTINTRRFVPHLLED